MIRQTDFAAALLAPDTVVPDGLIDPQNRAAGRRFDVYRNNVTASLRTALSEAFPVVHALVGDAFFQAMAVVYLRQTPPSDPRLMLYGASFPSFLESFAPAASLPYLPDVARLEQALRESYHAADTRAVDPAAIAELAPDDLSNLTFTFAPSMHAMVSDHPIGSIWHAHQQSGHASVTRGAEGVLVTRPAFDPVVQIISHADVSFIRSMMAGQTLETAQDQAFGITEKFDLGATLGLLLSHGTIIKTGQKQ